MSGFITRRGAFALPMLAAGAASAQQQEFPNRPVTVIVPFPPGGATDLIARPLGAALQKVWGQSVVLQNRGGAAAVRRWSRAGHTGSIPRSAPGGR